MNINHRRNFFKFRPFLVSNMNITGFLILIIIREHVFN